jgi:hypothetical protein
MHALAHACLRMCHRSLFLLIDSHTRPITCPRLPHLTNSHTRSPSCCVARFVVAFAGADGEGDQGGHPCAVPRRQDHLPHQPIGPIRDWWATGRRWRHWPQDHRRHIRRLGRPRWWRLLGQGPNQGVCARARVCVCGVSGCGCLYVCVGGGGQWCAPIVLNQLVALLDALWCGRQLLRVFGTPTCVKWPRQSLSLISLFTTQTLTLVSSA